MEKSWKFLGVKGVTRSPLEWKIQLGKGQTEKKKKKHSLGGGGMDIFWNHPIEDRRNNGRDGTVI